MKIELSSSYRNVNMENIEPKSLKFHISAALVYIRLSCMYNSIFGRLSGLIWICAPICMGAQLKVF